MPTVYGVDLEDIPDGVAAIEALVIVKALGADNQLCLIRRSSTGLTPWETVGMLQIVLDGARDYAQDCYTSEDEDEDGEPDDPA